MVVNVTPRPLYPQERPGTRCIGDWVGPRAGLDGYGKSRYPTGIRSPARTARSQSLYRLSYRGTQQVLVTGLFYGKNPDFWMSFLDLISGFHFWMSFLDVISELNFWMSFLD